MRKINRIDLNNITKKNLEEKKKLLSDWLSSGKSKDEIKELQKNYRLSDVEKKLEEIQSYNWKLLCCYCETKDTNWWFDIEHVKPKQKIWYEQYCFDWENLLFACKKCNNFYKKELYEEWFLNPSDNSYFFENYFEFDENSFYITKTPEAEINERILQINEKDKHPFKMRQELKLELVTKFEEYKNDNLSEDTIKKYINRDFLLRWEMPSFWNYILERIIAKI